MKTPNKIVASLLLMSVCAIQAQASGLKTDFLLFLPKTTVKSIAPEFKGTFQYQAANLTVPGDFPAHLQNVNVTFNYTVKSLTPNAQGNFDIDFAIDSAKATVEGLHIDSFIERVVNGQPVRVHLKADCSGLTVTGKAGFSASGVGQIVNNPLAVSINDMQWATSALWTLQANSCQGPGGLVPFLEEQINQMWLQPQHLKGLVMGELNNRILGWMNERSNWTQNLSDLNAMMFVRAHEFIDSSSAWILRMAVDFQTMKECPSFDQVGTLPAQQVGSVPTGIELQAPLKLTALWGQCIHEMGAFNRRDNTKDIPAFGQLMGSDTYKQAVWPDLMRFSTSAQFNFYTVTSGGLQIQPRTVSNPAANTLYFSAATTLVSTMKYINKGVEEPYMTFATPVRGGIQAVGKAGAFDKAGTILMQWSEDPQVKLNYRFDVSKSVVKDTKVDTTKLDPELVKTLKAKSFTHEVEPMSISNTHQITMSGLKKTGEIIQVLFGVTRKN